MNLPESSINSLVKASARSVNGSSVESVRVAKAIVNMLLREKGEGMIFFRHLSSQQDEVMAYFRV